MYGLFFEVIFNKGHAIHYFDHVSALKEDIVKEPGLCSLNRFTSKKNDNHILSHQLWLDIDSINRWRSHSRHKVAQKAGQKKHFSDYRIRIGRRLEYNFETNPETKFAMNADGISHILLAIHFKSIIENSKSLFWESVCNKPTGLVLSEFRIDQNWFAKSMSWLNYCRSKQQFDHAEMFAIQIDYGMYERKQAPEMRPQLNEYND